MLGSLLEGHDLVGLDVAKGPSRKDMTSWDWTLQRDPPQGDFLAYAGKQL